MERNEYNDLTRASIGELIKTGIIKSVSNDLIHENNRLMVKLEGKNSAIAKTLIGSQSSEIIIKNNGLDQNLLDEASLIIVKGNGPGRIRFTTTKYTNLHRIFNIPDKLETRKKAAKDLKIITLMLEEYWN